MPTADERYEAELRQGRALAAAEVDEEVWGWSGRAGTLRADRRAAFLASACRLGPGVRCLELGAGTGEFTRRLAASGCELTAIELSPDTARRCRERAPGVEVLVGNIESGEGLAGREFDAIVGVSVLHHVDLAAALATTFARLRPGGRFAFSEPNLLNPQVWLERNVGWVARRRHVLEHERAFTAGRLRDAFESAGYVVATAEAFEFLHPATPPALVRLVLEVERALEATPLRAIGGSVRIAGYRRAAPA